MKRIMKNLFVLLVMIASLASAKPAQAGYKSYRKFTIIYKGDFSSVKVYMKKRGESRYKYKGRVKKNRGVSYTVRSKNHYFVKLVSNNKKTAISHARVTGYKNVSIRMRSPYKGQGAGSSKVKMTSVTIRLRSSVDGRVWKVYLNGKAQGSVTKGRYKTIKVKPLTRNKITLRRGSNVMTKYVRNKRPKTIWFAASDGASSSKVDAGDEGDKDADSKSGASAKAKAVKKITLTVRIYSKLKGYKWKVYVDDKYIGEVKRNRWKYVKVESGKRTKIEVRNGDQKVVKYVNITRRKTVQMGKN